MVNSQLVAMTSLGLCNINPRNNSLATNHTRARSQKLVARSQQLFRDNDRNPLLFQGDEVYGDFGVQFPGNLLGSKEVDQTWVIQNIGINRRVLADGLSKILIYNKTIRTYSNFKITLFSCKPEE